jgi:hypothetical protein
MCVERRKRRGKEELDADFDPSDRDMVVCTCGNEEKGGGGVGARCTF